MIYGGYVDDVKVVFRSKYENKYLVLSQIEGEDADPEIMTADKIFDMMDLRDCYDIKIDLYKINKPGNGVTPCVFKGTWHDGHDPLKMVIETEDGKELDVGYGTDH